MRQLITGYTPITIVTEDREIRSYTHEVVEHGGTISLARYTMHESKPIIKSIIDGATLRAKILRKRRFDQASLLYEVRYILSF